MKAQRGGFVVGLIVGLLAGLALSLGVALYVTKVPVPFINKVPQRSAEHDAAQAEKNRLGPQRCARRQTCNAIRRRGSAAPRPRPRPPPASAFAARSARRDGSQGASGRPRRRPAGADPTLFRPGGGVFAQRRRRTAARQRGADRAGREGHRA